MVVSRLFLSFRTGGHRISLTPSRSLANPFICRSERSVKSLRSPLLALKIRGLKVLIKKLTHNSIHFLYNL